MPLSKLEVIDERKKLKKLEEKVKAQKLRKEREEVDKQLAKIKGSGDESGGVADANHPSDSKERTESEQDDE